MTELVTRTRIAPATVDPTDTILATVDVRATRLLSVSAKNLDVGVQTVTVTIFRRAHPLDDFAPGATYDDLTDIPPGAQRQVDVDVGSNFEAEIHAITSGIGTTINLTVKPGEPYP